MKKIKLTARVTCGPHTLAPNRVRQPVQINQIIAQRPDRLLNVTKARAGPQMCRQTPQCPLVARLFAMIGTVHPEARIGQPAIGQHRI